MAELHRDRGRAVGVLGIDVASYRGDLDWPDYYDAGKRFAYVKATEGTGYENPYFATQ